MPFGASTRETYSPALPDERTPAVRRALLTTPLRTCAPTTTHNFEKQSDAELQGLATIRRSQEGFRFDNMGSQGFCGRRQSNAQSAHARSQAASNERGHPRSQYRSEVRVFTCSLISRIHLDQQLEPQIPRANELWSSSLLAQNRRH
jgi:hypothetical protein